MTNELSKIDPKEYGLEQKQVATIEQAFAPKIAERDALLEMYESMLKVEITPAVCKQAKELRLKLVKVRTGISEIHKTQKAFFLAAGRFVDAWKNKETVPIEQMEENLTDIEKYYERLEAEKVAKLATEREAEIRQYSDVMPYDLGHMELSVYTNYLTGLKVAQEARVKAEKEEELAKQEAERIEKLNTDRKNKTVRLVEFIENYENLSFGEMTEESFMEIVNTAIKKRTDHEAEQERIRVENEMLKKEAEENEKALAAERAEAERKQKAVEAAAEAERKKNERIQKEKDAENLRLAAKLKEKLDAEIAEKAEADRKEKERITAEEIAAKAPRKQKLTVWVDGFAIPEFANDEVAADIAAKFVAFKGWAKGQVEKL